MPQSLRILVADDYLDSAETLGALLRDNGYQVCVTSSGPEAIQQAPNFKPDVVILDLMMPGTDGFKTAAQLIAEPSTQNATYVAHTGVSTPDIGLRCKRSGFRYMLRKPARLEEIEILLRTIAVERRQANQGAGLTPP